MSPISSRNTGLVVTVTPSQSAFFAGEMFSATISFTNAATPLPAQRSSSRSQASKSGRPFSVNTPAGGRGGGGHKDQSHAPSLIRARPPSASHLNIAEYATNYLATDDVPESPFVGSNSGTFTPMRDFSNSTVASQSDSLPPSSFSTNGNGGGGGGSRQSSHSRQPSFANKNNAVAMTSTKTGDTNPYNTNTNRSLSGMSTFASTSRLTLPTRKGLIGEPLTYKPVLDRKVNSSGLYASGPRRPGGGSGSSSRGGGGSHGRTQSMAVSSPDLLVNHSDEGDGSSTASSSSRSMSTPMFTHGRSRLGGSLGGEALRGVFSGSDDSRKASRLSSVSNIIAEQDTEDTMYDSQSPDIDSPMEFKFEEDKYHPDRLPPQLPPNASTLSLLNNDGSEREPSELQTFIPGQNLYGMGENGTMETLVREGVDDWRRRERIASEHHARLEKSARQQHVHQPSYSTDFGRNHLLHAPNTIGLLWSFAHFEGTFEVDELLVKTSEFLEVKKALIGGMGSGLGGGTLEEPKGRGWTDWIWGKGGDRGAGRAGASLEERKNLQMKDKTVPTFSSPPSILGVDIVLEPGESKSYTFSIRLPADLPPAFRGKSIKFVYQLVVGTNRSPLGPVLMDSFSEPMSRIMKVPVRVYNHVGVTGARPFYDLTNPVIHTRDEATIVGDTDTKITKSARRPSTGRRDFEAYAAALLDSVTSLSPDLAKGNVFASAALSPSMTFQSPTIMENPPALRPEMRPRSGSMLDGADGEERVECKSAVEIVTRNSQKVSYDINKDGYMVATLTLVKSAYRLGETVNGSVVLNSGEGRVLRLSARLETHELVETSISTRSAPQVRHITRRLHSEHHESTLDAARIGFALAIPSGATPDFGTSGVKLQWSVRLSFLVIPPSPDSPVGQPGLTSSERPPPHGRLTRPSPPPSAPPPAGGGAGASRHGRSKSFAYGFEPAVPLTLPAAPSILPTGAAHLMPVLGADASPNFTSYRAVPDLGFVPVIFSSATTPNLPPPPGPLQRSASGSSISMHKSSGSLSSPRSIPPPIQQANVVLVPAKVETVECSIPIKVYPGNTPFRPTVTVFDA